MSKNQLIDLYWNKQKSSRQIASLLGVTQTSVLDYMNKYKIPRRERSIAIRLHPPSGQFAKGVTPWNKGKNSFNDPRIHLGEKSNHWKGGITPLTKRVRASFKYRQWRSDVFTRDDFTCQECGRRGCFINAHHIVGFDFIFEINNIRKFEEAEQCEELWNINNGITLCEECHDLTKGRPIHDV